MVNLYLQLMVMCNLQVVLLNKLCHAPQSDAHTSVDFNGILNYLKQHRVRVLIAVIFAILIS